MARLVPGAVVCLALLLAGCDLFYSRGDEGQRCFENMTCSGDLVCVEGRCLPGSADGGDPGPDAGDPAPDGGDPGSDPGSDPGADPGDPGHDAGDQDIPPVNHVYRSVGFGQQDPVADQTADNLMTISSGQAVFTNDLPDVVGVGDVIHYNANEVAGRDSIAFIHERVNAKVFVIANAAGGLPNPTTEEEDWAIYRAYTSLANALSMAQNDDLPDFDADYLEPKNLVSHNRVHHIACYGPAVDTDEVATILHWETDEDHYLHIFTPVTDNQVGTSQRHTGRWTETAYTLKRVCGDYDNMLRIGSGTVHIEGLQIQKVGTDTTRCNAIQLVNEAVVYLSHTIIQGEDTNGSGVHLSSSTALLNMWNNVIVTAAVDVGDAITVEAGTHAFIYNNTLFNSYHGVGGQNEECPDVVLINNIAIGNTAIGGGDFRSGMTFSPHSSHNCSSDQTAEEVNGTHFTNDATAACLSDPGTVDLHLVDGCPCIDQGTDLSDDSSLPVNDDIDGDERSLGTGWDPGADEYDLN